MFISSRIGFYPTITAGLYPLSSLKGTIRESRNPENASSTMLQGILEILWDNRTETCVPFVENRVGSTKPIRVDGNGEFGEKYHTSIALLRDQKLRAVVFGPDSQHAKPFLSLFASDRVLSANGAWRKRDCRPASKSTSIYCREPWSIEAAQRWGEIALHAVIGKADEVREFLRKQIAEVLRPAALVWIRRGKYDQKRNSTAESTLQLIEVIKSEGFHPILIGERVAEYLPKFGNLIEFYKDRLFGSEDSICTQLLMLHMLTRDFCVRVSVGMKSGGMDGAGFFFGLRTISFSHCTGKSRIERIAKTIKNFSVIPLDVPRGKMFHRHSETELQNLRSSLRLLP